LTNISDLRSSGDDFSGEEKSIRLDSTTRKHDNKVSTYTRISISNCIRDGEISDVAIGILEMFPSAYMERDPTGTGLTLLVGGKKPAWCKKHKRELDSKETIEVCEDNDWLPVTRISFGAPVPVEEVGNHTRAIAELCEELFPAEKELFHADKEELFAVKATEPSEPHTSYDPYHEFLKHTIHKMCPEFLKIRWENYADPLIILSLLEIAYEEKCGYEDGDLFIDAADRDIRKKTNLSRATIDRRIKYLNRSNYSLSILDKGRLGKNSKYRISPTYKISKRYRQSSPLRKEDMSCFEKGSNTINLMDHIRTSLGFSSLTPAQIYAIILLSVVGGGRFPMDDLYASMNYSATKKNFQRYVISPLLERGVDLITVDKKIISLQPDLEERVKELFDEEKYREVQEEVARDREVYKELILYGDIDEEVRHEALRNRVW
jgi:hypothetical protein